MDMYDKIVTWVLFILFIALAIGCIGAFAYSWTWHNIVLALLAMIAAMSLVDDYKNNKEK